MNAFMEFLLLVIEYLYILQPPAPLFIFAYYFCKKFRKRCPIDKLIIEHFELQTQSLRIISFELLHP